MKQLILKLMVLFGLFVSLAMPACLAATESFIEKVEYYGFSKKQESLFGQYLDALSKDVNQTGTQTSTAEVVYILQKVAEKKQLRTTVYVKGNTILLFHNHKKDAESTAW